MLIDKLGDLLFGRRATRIMSTAADVDVTDHGTLFLFHLNTFAAHEWVEYTVQADVLWEGNAIVVHPEYARGLAQAMIDDGLKLS